MAGIKPASLENWDTNVDSGSPIENPSDESREKKETISIVTTRKKVRG